MKNPRPNRHRARSQRCFSPHAAWAGARALKVTVTAMTRRSPRARPAILKKPARIVQSHNGRGGRQDDIRAGDKIQVKKGEQDEIYAP